MSKYTFYSSNSRLYEQMLEDIKNATGYIYLETYIFQGDAVGEKIKEALIQKAKEGVEVKLLFDSVGSIYLAENYFKELINAGGQAAFFKKIRLWPKHWKDMNRRDHRKLLVIDDKIIFIGSSNIVEKFMDWREFNVRMENSAGHLFREIFLQMFELAKTHYYSKRKALKIIKTKEYEIIRDTPSLLLQPIKNRILEMIRNAQKEIWIETPYFICGKKIIRELIRAKRDGVKISLVVPENSDHTATDILNKYYLAKLYRAGITPHLYSPVHLHSKLIMADREKFFFGSANFDFRSFILQFEIGLYGRKGEIVEGMKKHFEESLKYCRKFDYGTWKKRPLHTKTLEKLLLAVKYLF